MYIGPKITYLVTFLPVILFIGVVTSYEDFNYSKIKNKWILAGLGYSFAVYLLFWVLHWKGLADYYLLYNFGKWCINLMVSAVMAYLLWRFKMWGAGDAKLFICYSALIPMGQYSKVYFSYYFASFLLLLAIFIPATLFLTVKASVYFIKRFDFNKLKEDLLGLTRKKFTNFSKVNFFKVFLGFIFLFLFFKLVRGWLYSYFNGRISINQDIITVFCLLMFRQLSNFFNKRFRFMVFVSVILVMYLGFNTEYPLRKFILEITDTLGNAILVIVLFPILKKILDLYTARLVQQHSPFAMWMFLGALITWFL